MNPDRPLRRRLVKLGFSLLRGRSHQQEVWPGLVLQRAGETSGRVIYKGRPVTPLLPVWRLFERMRVAAPVIVGTGPSMAGQDRRVLQDGRAVLLNGAVSLLPEIGMPMAVVVEDERFVWKRFDMLRGLPPETLLVLSPAVIRAVLERERGWLERRPVVLAENLLKPFDAPRRKADDPALRDVVLCRGDAALSLDPGRGVIVCGTVAFTALQFALASGAEEIGLAGVDLTDTALPRFYETTQTQVWSGLAAGMPRILSHFALAAEEARYRGVRLGCHSPKSRLLALGYAAVGGT